MIYLFILEIEFPSDGAISLDRTVYTIVENSSDPVQNNMHQYTVYILYSIYCIYMEYLAWFVKACKTFQNENILSCFDFESAIPIWEFKSFALICASFGLFFQFYSEKSLTVSGGKISQLQGAAIRET